MELLTFLIFIEIKIKTISFIINGLMLIRTLLSTHLSNILFDHMYAYIHISHSALIRE